MNQLALWSEGDLLKAIEKAQQEHECELRMINTILGICEAFAQSSVPGMKRVAAKYRRLAELGLLEPSGN